MLTESEARADGHKIDNRFYSVENGKSIAGSTSGSSRRWSSRVMSIEWLGQTAASLCWIISVMVCGVNSTGDGLQLLAASFWLVANIASAFNFETEKT